MSYVVTCLEVLRDAAEQARHLAEEVVDVNDPSKSPEITAVVAPGLDEDSEMFAASLREFGQQYRQAIAAATVILEEFALALDAGAAKYATAEDDNITALSYES
ncbi:PE family protein [Mycobacterium haemophilum]